MCWLILFVIWYTCAKQFNKHVCEMCVLMTFVIHSSFPSVLWHCWFVDGKKSCLVITKYCSACCNNVLLETDARKKKTAWELSYLETASKCRWIDGWELTSVAQKGFSHICHRVSWRETSLMFLAFVDMLFIVLKTSTSTILSAMKKRKWYEIRDTLTVVTINDFYRPW